jgi:predicted adenylyl cyclase CyaB
LRRQEEPVNNSAAPIKMSKETEIKLKYNNRNQIIQLIKKLGAKFKEKYELHDTYFSFHKNMSKNHEIVRVREKGKSCELTFKGKCKSKGDLWERTELTCKIDNPKNMCEILTNLGLFKIKENISKREIYLLEDLEIVFIDFSKPTKLSLIELEGPESKIKKIIKLLGTSVKIVGEEAFNRFDSTA